MNGTASLPDGWRDALDRYDHPCHKCHRTIAGHMIEARAGRYKIYCVDMDVYPVSKGDETPMPWSYPEVMAIYLEVGKGISYGLMKRGRDELKARMGGR